MQSKIKRYWKITLLNSVLGLALGIMLITGSIGYIQGNPYSMINILTYFIIGIVLTFTNTLLNLSIYGYNNSIEFCKNCGKIKEFRGAWLASDIIKSMGGKGWCECG